jgi:nucleoside-diphosphate-sugar epimerase
MKILILGSSGQIGQELASNISSDENECISIDIKLSDLHDLRKKNQFLEENFENADFIYFLAFDVGGSNYLSEKQNTLSFLLNNTEIMLNTFKLIKKYNKKFIFASTQMSNMNYSSYGVLKRLGEFYTEVLGGVYVKFWNVYGYEVDEDKMHVISDFIRMGLNEGRIRMRTDGKEERDFLHVSDCVTALEIIRKELYEVKNYWDICSFMETKIIDVAKIISIKLGIPYILGPKSDDVQKNKKNLPERNILDFWSPKLTLEEGIQIEIDRVRK